MALSATSEGFVFNPVRFVMDHMMIRAIMCTIKQRPGTER